MNSITAIITFTGFTEGPRRASGTEMLHRLTLRPWGLREDVDVWGLRAWDSDTEGLAEQLARYEVTDVVIVAYSWGAGYAAQNFARACAEVIHPDGGTGLRVGLMLLCDPVYRPHWLPRWGFANLFAFRAVVPMGATVKIPGNVERVGVVRQDGSRPKGHPIRRLSEDTVVLAERLVKDTTHSLIDEHPEWVGLVQRELKLYLND